VKAPLEGKYPAFTIKKEAGTVFLPLAAKYSFSAGYGG
jgi:hypothetical protein